MTFTDIIQFLLTGEVKTGMEKLRIAAEKGSAVAQLELGLCYYTGHGMPRNEEEAVKWFHSAAGQGSAKAQFYLGRARLSGEGIPKEHESAYAWFDVAAANGYKKAEEWCGLVSREMTPEQIEEGRRLAKELKERFSGVKSRMRLLPFYKRRTGNV